ncbi:MAG: hypothetical protein IIC82_08715, partial [Chloroflexi bacterium]|nr:hypothetical protein [Chloroflexota bacterium]
MVNMLAGMPGMMRKQMMKGRLNQLLTLNEDKRQETMLGMFSSFHNPSVKQSNREKVITTRVEIIGELTEEKRRTLIKSRLVALRKNPDIEAQDLNVQDAVMPKVSSKARTAFIASWTAIQKSSEN